MTDRRPAAEAMLVHVFDKGGAILPQAKRRAEWLSCTRRLHRIAILIRTPYGWWVAWRRPDAAPGAQWDYAWADEIDGYTEATCHCRRLRRIDDLIRQMR